MQNLEKPINQRLPHRKTFHGPTGLKIAKILLTGVILTSFGNVSLRATEEDISELHKLIDALRAEVGELRSEVVALKQQQNMTARVTTPATQTPANAVSVTPIAEVKTAAAPSPFQLYGYFKTDVFRDSATTAYQEIPFWSIIGSENKPEVDFTARQTRIGVNMTSPGDYAGGKITGKLETDFYGFIPSVGNVSGNHAYQLRTRLAYLKWSNADWDILAGKNWETYTLFIPDTLNFAYYSFQGQLGLRKTQLQITRNLKLSGDSKLAISGSIAEPVGGIHGGDLDGNGTDDATRSQMPQIALKSIYSTKLGNGKTAEFGVSGFYEKENVWNKDFDAYAFILGAKIPLSDSVTILGNWWTGSNLDSAWGGIGQGINTATHEAIDGQGAWVQLNYKPNPKVWFNLGYSFDDPEDSDLNAAQRSKNTTYLFNAYYQLFSPLRLGFEYFQTNTEYIDYDTVTNHRLMGSVIYAF